LHLPSDRGLLRRGRGGRAVRAREEGEEGEESGKAESTKFEAKQPTKSTD
jgi:hypothetical protein